MKLPVAILISLYVFALPTSHAQTNAARTGVSPTASARDSHLISITRSASRQPSKGPSERFTGTVQIEPLFSAHDPSRVIGGSVTFQPGARTAWHTHPLGQILIVTAGVGWVAQWGGPVQEIREGDVVWIPAGVKHWHGATPNTAMTHIAILEELNGNSGEWLEKVSDEQYRK